MSEFFAQNDEDGWDHETGKIGVLLFANAVQVWSISQGRATSVADAASAFNCSPTKIVEAVRRHYWMLLSGHGHDFENLMIEHEGE